MKIINIEEIANYFLSKESMSLKKLNKLCYYAYVWTLVYEDEYYYKIDTKFQAWVHGCSNPTIFNKYKDKYRDKDIPKIEKYNCNFTVDYRELINEVYESYGKYNGEQLEYLNHNELPWQEARGDLQVGEACYNEIDENTIKWYYGKQVDYDKKEEEIKEILDYLRNYDLGSDYKNNINRLEELINELKCN